MTNQCPTSESENSRERPSDNRYALIGRVLGMRSSDHSAGVLAAIRAGIVPATEALAFPFTESALNAWPSERSRTGVRRAAAMVALHRDVHQFVRSADSSNGPRRYSVGRSLRLLHLRSFGYAAGHIDAVSNTPRRNALTMQVDALPLLGLEEAASSISLLVGRCGGENVSVDFYDVARALAGWGDGIAPMSRRTRNRVVQDFYGSPDD